MAVRDAQSMNTRHGFCSLVLWAAVVVIGSFGAPRPAAAMEVTVSFGELHFSWPWDEQALYWRLQELADKVCEYVDAIGWVTYV